MRALEQPDLSPLILTYTDYTAAGIQLIESLTAARVPLTLHKGLVRYFLDGIPPGHFLRAVLENNLQDAVLRADEPACLHSLILWLLNVVPAPSWGDPRAVEQWIARKAAEREAQ
jgi:hypothetical protein